MLFEWLATSIDPARAHMITAEISWHARLMIVAWSFCIPLGIISARFFKIMPRQDWPNELDNRTWWLSHLILQYLGGAFTLVALWIIWDFAKISEASSWHTWLGWIVVILCLAQFLAGWFRGTKGGPSEVSRTGTIRGDHYDMTPRRNLFEYFHKSAGYICLLTSFITTAIGLWSVNAPRWMWIALAIWWLFIIVIFVVLQRAGKTYDTYQALWGDDPELPGNRKKPIGIGISRVNKQ
ncbi:cytochrome b561 domain-containing protein [Lentilitoribacter sp. Alg239-R112]|uniref:cytochrome b561 domain-containing protein n=1 Tax=Lentilitoribacter sp. Alg239-R112 TaxID=2305987 RepID=UPI0013A6BDB5|nr:cytochrome b561 domain-containing protein [Lentilitoribacter sp. Alg239-R112]